MQPRKKKPRLSILQRVFFSLGHIFNDFVLAIYSSYLLIYQTKVLGLSSVVVGLVWLIPNAVDAFLALLVGYICDNFVVPGLSKCYGRRKSWHLLGCILLGISFPFLLMPCLFNTSSGYWVEAVYYIIITEISYLGYCFTHANQLAMIPDIAKRPSEMVELGAISSSVTFASGIFVYAIVWALLDGDSSGSFSDQQTVFTHLTIIVVSLGAFFTFVFHAGTHEPRRTTCKESKQKDDLVGFSECDYHEKPLPYTLPSTHALNINDVIQGTKDTALVNPTFVADIGDIQAEICEKRLDLETEERDKERAVQRNVIETIDKLEAADTISSCSSGFEEFELSSHEDNPSDGNFSAIKSENHQHRDTKLPHSHAPQNEGPLYLSDSTKDPKMGYTGSDAYNSCLELPRNTSVLSLCEDLPYTNVSTSHIHGSSAEGSRDTESVDMYMPETYLDGVAHHSSLFLRSRPGSRASRVTPLSTPRLSRHTRAHNLPLGSNFSLSRRASHGPSPLASTVLSLPGTQDYLTKKLTDIREVVNVLKAETNASDFVIIERSRPIERDGGSWRRLFTNPMFYKIGFAYMCTRMAQNVTNAYFPIFLTDHLKFGKQAIAYFPLVTLISGVFASVATKTLNRILGNKWTFCVGALVVMGSSLWFYSLTKETRSATYAPAIMSGCGTSIMFVTTLALAAELVDQDRSSGAFVMASMSFLSKIVLGTLFFFLQELAPKSSGATECAECLRYVHYVFSLTPGVSAFLGLVGFFIFIPATVKCRTITHTVDAETQTDASIFAHAYPPAHESRMCEHELTTIAEVCDTSKEKTREREEMFRGNAVETSTRSGDAETIESLDSIDTRF
ncbi:major facilitator superfamily domain-containing protein 12 [Nematostella vectensis]|uniref:major facilitator superfamily domain-containing protein 12 n=1 Tax=Nematostella vectensis TaxID=45351 RepID=UPI002076DC35|nr:major facilitator superfamily domain-containing protein 12 [Nematostella vectensis]